MTDHAALRAALAEALAVEEFGATTVAKDDFWLAKIDRILAHPAVLAALDRSDAYWQERAKEAENQVRIRDEQLAAVLDRSDPATGLRAQVYWPAGANWQSGKREVIVELAPIVDGLCSGCGTKPTRETGSCRCLHRIGERLAATPTASPTDRRVRDETDQEAHHPSCCGACDLCFSACIAYHGPLRRSTDPSASPTATGERDAE